MIHVKRLNGLSVSSSSAPSDSDPQWSFLVLPTLQALLCLPPTQEVLAPKSILSLGSSSSRMMLRRAWASPLPRPKSILHQLGLKNPPLAPLQALLTQLFNTQAPGVPDPLPRTLSDHCLRSWVLAQSIFFLIIRSLILKLHEQPTLGVRDRGVGRTQTPFQGHMNSVGGRCVSI